MADWSDVSIRGPLASYAPGFRAELARLGYARRWTGTLIELAGELSDWLDGQGLDVDGLTPEAVERFLGARAETCGWFRPTAKTLVSLLGYLRDLGAVPQPMPLAERNPLDDYLQSYRRYLVQERGLVEGTVKHYVKAARLFLSEHFGDAWLDIASLSAADVASFVNRQCPRRSVASAKNLLTGLRSLLTFTYREGLTSAPLAQAVPSAAGWSGSALPRALGPGDVARMLASCNRGRTTGERDYAILVLLVRLGLRAGEVATLTLDDLDWRSGEIVVRGKGRREERLPLPTDVGEALATYLRRRRSRVGARALFLRAHAPVRELTASGVSEVVRAAAERAGLPGVGAHRLRHTAATEMLRAGAPLAEIAQVLRHRNAATTAMYAKVDHAALSSLALPWPAGTR